MIETSRIVVDTIQLRREAFKDYFGNSLSKKEFLEKYKLVDNNGWEIKAKWSGRFWDSLNDMVGDFQFAIKPNTKKVKPTDTLNAFKSVVGKDELRPAMTGVYNNGKVMAATNANTLVVAKVTGGELQKEEVISLVTNKPLKVVNFLTYWVVLPIHRDKAIKNVDLGTLLNNLGKTKTANKVFADGGDGFSEFKGLLACFEVDNNNYWFSPGLLEDTITALLRLGVTKANLFFGTNTQGLLITDPEDTAMAFIMPCYRGYNPGLGPHFMLMEGRQEYCESAFVHELITTNGFTKTEP